MRSQGLHALSPVMIDHVNKILALSRRTTARAAGTEDYAMYAPYPGGVTINTFAPIGDGMDAPPVPAAPQAPAPTVLPAPSPPAPVPTSPQPPAPRTGRRWLPTILAGVLSAGTAGGVTAWSLWPGYPYTLTEKHEQQNGEWKPEWQMPARVLPDGTAQTKDGRIWRKAKDGDWKEVIK